MRLTKPVRLCLGVGFAGFCCLALALVVESPWTWLLLWTAVACLVVSAAYGLNRPDVFGKRRGRRGFLHTAITLPYLVALWSACMFLRIKRRLPPVSLVAPGLYVAGRIRARDLPGDVEYVVDLTSEFSAARAVRELPGYRSLPLLDGSYPPRDDGLLDLLGEISATGSGVLVHCESGVGRAPTIAALILIARGQANDPETAIALIKRSRPAIKPTLSDYRFMRRFSRALGGRASARAPESVQPLPQRSRGC